MSRLASMLALAVILAWAQASARAEPLEPSSRPQRIVSLNLCTDELLMRLADPEQIASISWLARDPILANLSAQAAQFPTNRGMAEEILGLRPDLVLAGRYTTTNTVALLRRLGFQVIEFDFPATISETATLIRHFGKAIGQEERSALLADTMLADFESLKPLTPDAHRPTAIIYQPNGFTAGKGSLIDSLMEAAGLHNVARDTEYSGYTALPLELLVKASPDIMIIEDETAEPALAQQFLDHQVLAKMPKRPVPVVMPSRLWTCAGPAMIDAVRQLRAIRDQLTLAGSGKRANQP